MFDYIIKLIRFFGGKFIQLINRFIDYLRFKKYYKNKELTSEEQEVYDYINNKKLLYFMPYEFKDKYKLSNIKLYFENKIPYVIHNNKKLYLKKCLFKFLTKRIYNDLLIEKNIKSPHNYVDKNFKVDNNSIIIDCGSAEGIFSIDHIDLAKKIYLIEPDINWWKPLEKTFKPYNNKVELIKKYITNNNESGNITIDKILKNVDSKERIFIKSDIEGFESKMLEGATETLKRFSNIKLSLCAYHKEDDLDNIIKKFGNDFSIKINKGYILFIYDIKRLRKPFLRRGVIKISKKI